ncbi:hypothetical protein BD289DRAFT_40854 [Coniella lustricola]|uniref:Uncharacterized protein n=1 Tax=Coniella lustricola TaxID=2025994 RepID=A0A2T3A1Z4_9PEZI|nr:hypothetical protein BD289DRAFT_40854 [Coniella lustricola]
MAVVGESSACAGAARVASSAPSTEDQTPFIVWAWDCRFPDLPVSRILCFGRPLFYVFFFARRVTMELGKGRAAAVGFENRSNQRKGGARVIQGFAAARPNCNQTIGVDARLWKPDDVEEGGDAASTASKTKALTVGGAGMGVAEEGCKPDRTDAGKGRVREWE